MNHTIINYLKYPVWLVSILVFIPSIMFGTSTLAFKFNGHKYSIPEDYLVRAINEAYDQQRTDLQNSIQDYAISQGFTGVTVSIPENVNVSYTEKYTDYIKIRMKFPDGTWSEIDSIPDMEGDPWQSKLAVNDQGLHIVWKAHTDEWDYDIYYQMRTHDGEWKERQQISLTISPSLDPCIYLKDNQLHIAWVEILGETKRDNIDVYYQSIDLTD